MIYQRNPESVLDMSNRSLVLFDRFGDVLHRNSRKVYTALGRVLKGKTVCDVGCGCGYGTAVLERAGVAAWGLDTCARALAFGRCLYPWLRLEERNALAVSLREESMDAAVCVDVLEHLNDLQAMIANVCAAAKDVWFATPNRNSPGVPQDRPSISFHVQEYSPGEMLEMLSPLGTVHVYTVDLELVPLECVPKLLDGNIVYEVLR